MGFFSSITRSIGRAISGVVGALAGDFVRVALTTTLGPLGAAAAGLVVSSMVSSTLGSSLTSRNTSVQKNAYDSQANNRQTMVKQPILPRDTVYGATKKSGGILFVESTNNNKRLHLVIQVASHEIQSFDKIYFNEEELTLASIGTDSNGPTRFKVSSPSKFSKDSNASGLPLSIFYTRQAVEFKLHKGGDDQLADADLVTQVSKWTTDHRLRGIAYIYAQLDYDADMFPNGLPNISAEISGKKVLDFRSGSTAHSSNPALCIYDYLTDTRLGLGISTSDIDTTSFTT